MIRFNMPLRHPRLLVPTLLLIGATVFVGLGFALARLPEACAGVRWRVLLGFVAIAGLFLVSVGLVQNWLVQRHADPTLPGLDPGKYVRQLVYFSIVRPGNHLVNHAVYLGPIVLVAVFCWGVICRTAARHGLGVYGLLVLVVLFSIDVETRRVLQILLLLIPFVVQVVDERGLSGVLLCCLLPLSLFNARFWMTLNVGDPERLRIAFPERYFWTQGPWMTDTVFVWQVLGLAGAAVLLLLGGKLGQWIQEQRGRISNPGATQAPVA